MPLYNFQCTECNHQFEHLELPSAPEEKLLTCPSCTSSDIKKLFAPTNISVQYKADGFYSTDTAKKDISSKKSS